MSLRPPGLSAQALLLQTGADQLAVEIMAEKADALGRAGARAERAMAALEATAADDPARPAAVRAAADALYGLFIQRELMGYRGHAEVVETLRAPREVLAKIGAR